jgi:hypothetical protein
LTVADARDRSSRGFFDDWLERQFFPQPHICIAAPVNSRAGSMPKTHRVKNPVAVEAAARRDQQLLRRRTCASFPNNVAGRFDAKGGE